MEYLYLLKHIWNQQDVIIIVILLVLDPATPHALEIANIVVLTAVKDIVRAVVKEVVK